jgi:O-antigen ligase
MCFVLLLLFLFMIYTSPAYLAPALNADRAIPLVGIAAMVILMVHKMASKEKLQFQWPESYLMLGLIGAAGLSCFTAFSHNVAVAATGDLARIAVVYFLIINVTDSEHKIRMAALAMVAGGLFPAIAILKNYGTFEGPKDLAYDLVVLVPLTIQLARQVRPAFQPFLAGISVLYALAVIASGSQAGIFGLAAALSVMGLRQYGAFFLPLTAALLAGTVLFLSSQWTMDTLASNLNGQTGHSHTGVQQPIDTVRIVASIVGDHPILGRGLGCSRVAWHGNTGADIECSSLDTHNTVVQALSQIGVLGFIPFALLIVTAFIHFNRVCSAPLCNQSAASMTLGLEGSLVGFLVYGMFGNYLLSWSPYIVLGLVSALSLVLKRETVANELAPNEAIASTCPPAVLESA